MGPRRRDENSDNDLRRITSHIGEEASTAMTRTANIAAITTATTTTGAAAAAAAATMENGNIVDPEQFVGDPPERNDIWSALADGYTPLTDMSAWMADNDNGAAFTRDQVMVSVGPTNDSDEDVAEVDHFANTNADDDDDANGNGNGNRGNAWHRGGGAFFVNPAAFHVADNGDHNETSAEDTKEEKKEQDYTSNTSAGYDTLSSSDFEDVAARALRALDDEYQQSSMVPANVATGNQAANSPSKNETTNCSDRDMTDNRIIAAAFDCQKEELIRIQQREGFFVDWNMPSSNSTTDVRSQQRQVHEVDTDAVRRAVTALSSKSDDPFQRKFVAWQEKQQQTRSLKYHHDLIPATPCKAFHKSTPKAKQATAHLTRSCTIADALVRLQLTSNVSVRSPLVLLIDVVGVDHVECESAQRIERTFQPLVRWLASKSDTPFEEVHFRLIGRDLMISISHVNLMSGIATTTSSSLKRAIATCHSGVYHEFLDQDEGKQNDPNLVVAFNAGIWGYQEWESTIQYLAQRKQRSIMAITAYTLDECQGDYEVVERVSSFCMAEVLWKPEKNRFGSKMVRETKSGASEYRENAAWQAWVLGGAEDDNAG